MITRIEIENFKGVRERVAIDLAPITLLFGANSAGKSTILHALQYLSEVLERQNLDADRTVVGGDAVDLGGFKNLVHGHDTNQTVWIHVWMSDEEEFIDELYHPEVEAIAEHLGLTDRLNEEQDHLAADSELSVELGIAWSHARNCAFVSTYRLYFYSNRRTEQDPRYQVGPDEALLMEVSAHPDSNRVELSRLALDHPCWQLIGDWPDYAAYDSDDRDPIEDAGETVLWAILRECRQCFERIEASPGGNPAGAVPPILILDQQYGALPSPGNPFRFRLSGDTDPAWQHDGVRVTPLRLARELADELGRMLTLSLELLTEHTKHLRYLGPIREVPGREFRPTRSQDAATASGRSQWASGRGAWELLVRDDILIERVNEWLTSEDRLDAGFEIILKRFRELDETTPGLAPYFAGGAFDLEPPPIDFQTLPIGSRLVIRPRLQELELSPSDLGIGVSQVVPVIVTALVDGGGIRAIEQPELHLHPRLAAALGDLFIEAALRDYREDSSRGRLNKRRQFLIETHSEHLILRLLRRIRETTEGDLPPEIPQVTCEDISIAYMTGGGSPTRVTPLRITRDGDFLDRWPNGFFEERAEELF